MTAPTGEIALCVGAVRGRETRAAFYLRHRGALFAADDRFHSSMPGPCFRPAQDRSGKHVEDTDSHQSKHPASKPLATLDSFAKEAAMPLYESCKLRTGRYSQRGGIYLLSTVVLNRASVFRDFKLGRCVVREMMNAQRWNQAHSLAWVVMPDHFHWLVQLQEASLQSLMRQLKSRSTKAVNDSGARKGQLWQAGFHDRAVRKEEDLLATARYVVANPVRAGLVAKVGDYPLWDAVWL